MVGAKELDHEQGIGNQEFKADGEPQHLPTARQSLHSEASLERNFRRPHQLVEGCLQGFQPADGQALPLQVIRASANFGKASSSATNGHRRGRRCARKDPASAHCPCWGQCDCRAGIRRVRGAGSFGKVPGYQDEKSDRNCGVNEHDHLCKNLVSSLLKRVSSRATASESLPVTGEILPLLGIGRVLPEGYGPDH